MSNDYTVKMEKVLLNNLVKAPLLWKPIAAHPYHFSATWDGDEYMVRLNDFPAEPMCTIFIGNTHHDLDEWPTGWILPNHARPPTVHSPP